MSCWMPVTQRSRRLQPNCAFGRSPAGPRRLACCLQAAASLVAAQPKSAARQAHLQRLCQGPTLKLPLLTVTCRSFLSKQDTRTSVAGFPTLRMLQACRGAVLQQMLLLQAQSRRNAQLGLTRLRVRYGYSLGQAWPVRGLLR